MKPQWYCEAIPLMVNGDTGASGPVLRSRLLSVLHGLFARRPGTFAVAFPDEKQLSSLPVLFSGALRLFASSREDMPGGVVCGGSDNNGNSFKGAALAGVARGGAAPDRKPFGARVAYGEERGLLQLFLPAAPGGVACGRSESPYPLRSTWNPEDVAHGGAATAVPTWPLPDPEDVAHGQSAWGGLTQFISFQ